MVFFIVLLPGPATTKWQWKRKILLCLRTAKYKKFPLILNHHLYDDIGMLAFASRKPLTILVVKQNEKCNSFCRLKIFFYWIFDECELKIDDLFYNTQIIFHMYYCSFMIISKNLFMTLLKLRIAHFVLYFRYHVIHIACGIEK